MHGGAMIAKCAPVRYLRSERSQVTQMNADVSG